MVMKHLDHAPIVFNGHTIPVSQLGDIKDMELTEALQVMLDRGFFGKYPPGTNVFSVIEFSFKTDEITDVHRDRYLEVCDLLEAAIQLEKQGLDSSEARKAYERALRDHDMLAKLERP